MSELQFTPEQSQFLDSLLEHPCAPTYNHKSSDMLNQRSLQRVEEFERNVWAQTFWKPDGYPDWLEAFLERVCSTVPFYREQGRPSKVFEAIPTLAREVVREEPWSLVPDNLALQDLTVYTTSGTSGTKLSIPTHPVVSSMLLVLMEKLLFKEAGVNLRRGTGEVALALICCQEQTMTYPSLSHYLVGAAFLKVNLREQCWRDPAHRGEFLLAHNPGVLTGDPHSFAELAKLVPELRPEAMISSAVALHPGLKSELEKTFQCPVFDVYSLTEARFIAATVGDDRLELLSPDLYVEILGPDEQPMAEGSVGEITLTGGRNPYFPLLRYKTGDRGALRYIGGQPYLEKFEGRAEVYLANSSGERVPTLDVVHALRSQPLVGFSLEQDSHKSVKFRYAGDVEPKELEEPLRQLFGTQVKATRVSSWEGKPQRFGSELSTLTNGVG